MVNNFSETNYRANYKHYLGGPLVHFFRKLATEPTKSTVLPQIWHFWFEFIHDFFLGGGLEGQNEQQSDLMRLKPLRQVSSSMPFKFQLFHI